jgi:hypothetical protein
LGETALLPAWTQSFGSNFTTQDVAGSLVAVLAFGLLLYAPGFLLGWATNLFGFRRRSFPEQSCWAVVASFGLTPIVAYLLGRLVGLAAFCWAAAVAGVCVALLLSLHRTPVHWSSRNKRLMAGLGVAWVAFVVMSLVEIQVGNRLYFSVAMFDQSYRVAFTDAVARTGVPPANPLYFPGHAASMRYYYFWYVLCAAAMRIAGVTARQAFIASSVWAGFGLVATIALYLRHFFSVVQGLLRQTLVAVGLLFVTGADLLPAVGSLFAQRALNGEMEWWSEDQISSWMDSLLWVPHHVASLICCLLSFLLLWRTREELNRTQRCIAVALAGGAFASAFGLSIYVAFGMALLMAAWGIRLMMCSPKAGRTCGRIGAAGCIAAVLLTPFVRELLVGQGGGVSAHVFTLSVRRMIDPQLLTSLPVFATWHAVHPVVLDFGMRLLLLLPGLALELGFYGLALWFMRSSLQEESVGTAIYLAICGLAMVTFIRSAVIGNNDFGYRAALLPQFFLLLLGARLVGSRWTGGGEMLVPLTPLKRRAVVGLIVLGVAGTVYQAAMLRGFLPLEAARRDSGFAELPGEAFEAREAFAALRRVAPTDAVVQFNAVSSSSDPRGDVVPPSLFYERALIMDSGRQVLNAERNCAVEFGGDARPCAEIRSATRLLYAAGAPSAEWAETYCSRFGVGYLAVGHVDPAWGDSGGWVWNLPIVAAQPGFRILRCGASGAAGRSGGGT